MRRKLLRDLSANSLQLIITQLCALGIFYVLSVSFSKNDFGEINWSLSILLISFTILSFGIDQIVIKKIAEGIDPSLITSVYLVHVFISGLIFYTLLLLVHFIFPGFNINLLLLLGIGKLVLFFSSPFKQLANGQERFRILFYMSVCSAIIKSGLLLLFFFYGKITLAIVVIIFISGDAVEFLVSLAITKNVLKVPVILKIKKRFYLQIIRESIPQAGVVVFTSAIARFDWIFLGILATNIAVAEYSFAYKVFEVASLPLLIIAPVLVPRFTKAFQHSTSVSRKQIEENLVNLIRVEMIISYLTVLVLNILWVPVINFITHGKYGFSDRHIIFILSLSLPLLYLNNLFWTISFVNGKYKPVFKVFLITFLITISLDVILIPFLQGNGAAIAYLVALVCQFILFMKQTANFVNIKQAITPIIVCPLASLISGILATQLSDNTLIILLMAVLFFVCLLIISKQIIIKDFYFVKRAAGF